MATPRLTAFTLLLLWCERFKLVWSFPIILTGTCTQHLYGGACIKVLNSFLIWNRTLPYSRTLCRASPCPHFLFFEGGQRNVSTCCQQSFFGILLNGSILPPFVLATSPKVPPRQELPGDDRGRGSNPPAVAGRLFSFTIRPGRLSLPSVAYEFTSIPGRVQFPFYFSLVAVTRIRASVSTPPKLT